VHWSCKNVKESILPTFETIHSFSDLKNKNFIDIEFFEAVTTKLRLKQNITLPAAV